MEWCSTGTYTPSHFVTTVFQCSVVRTSCVWQASQHPQGEKNTLCTSRRWSSTPIALGTPVAFCPNRQQHQLASEIVGACTASNASYHVNCSDPNLSQCYLFALLDHSIARECGLDMVSCYTLWTLRPDCDWTLRHLLTKYEFSVCACNILDPGAQVSISNFKDFFDDYRGLFSSMLVKLQYEIWRSRVFWIA